LVLISILGFAGLAMGADSCETTESGGEKSADSAEKGKDEAEKPCGSRATDDCTPHVAANQSVRVDALTWKISDAKRAATLGDQSIGLGEKANGVYAVVNLRVSSDRDDSATLSDDIATLKVGNRSYKPDTDGTIAAVGAGEEPFFLEDIGPDSTLKGIIVFDLPPKVLKQKPELCFGEIGFGSTTGCIRMPAI